MRQVRAKYIEAFTNGTTYSDRYGNENSVVRMHGANERHEEMDQRGESC
jgi:hypothetical protein